MYPSWARLTSVTILAFLLQGGMTVTLACECDITAAPCRALWQADTVFVGRAEKVELVHATPPEYSHYRVTFTVARVLNGSRCHRFSSRRPKAAEAAATRSKKAARTSSTGTSSEANCGRVDANVRGP